MPKINIGDELVTVTAAISAATELIVINDGRVLMRRIVNGITEDIELDLKPLEATGKVVARGPAIEGIPLSQQKTKPEQAKV